MGGERQLFSGKGRWILIGVLLGSEFSGSARAQMQAKPEEVVFPSDGHGCAGNRRTGILGKTEIGPP